MAKLQYNELTVKKTVILDNDPYLVLSSAISKKDRQKASNFVKMKNLRTGSVIDRTFHQADVLEEADLEKRDVKFLYENRGEYWFCPPNNPSERFSFGDDVFAGEPKFLKTNSILTATLFNDAIMTVTVPIKVELRVKEASEAVKGNTSSGATKEVTLETGALIQVPQFINTGDIVAVNTESGTYSERVSKA